MKLVKKLLGSSLFIMLLVSTIIVAIVPMINVASAAPSTNIYVDPPEISGMTPSDNFTVAINVTDAPDTYGWEIRISWDPTLLNVTGKKEGDFLHRWVWDPWQMKYVPHYSTVFLSSPSFDEANLVGEMYVGCSLVGEVPWANGTGWLCNLNFTVKAEGSTLLNLADTYLFDHLLEGIPSPTYYPNNDCFFYNVEPSHDLRITDVTVFNASVWVGEVVNISVTVLNEGTVTEPDFDLIVYANEIVIGNVTGLSLNGTGDFEDRSSTYEVLWNTTDYAEGNYTISAYAEPVEDEVDTDDNTRIDGTVHVKILGDVNGDDKVDVFDLFNLGKAYGSEFGESNWDENCDFNSDDKVDDSDLIDLNKNYGRSL